MTDRIGLSTTPIAATATSGAFIGQPVAVNAVQWTGTQESLRLIQALLFPGSPLIATPGSEGDGVDRPTDGSYRFKHLGVHVTSGMRSIGTDLVHAQVGDWIVRQVDGRIEIVADAVFASRYTPAVFTDPRD